MFNFKTYLRNDSYNINISNECIYFLNYDRVIEINDDIIIVKFKDFILNIKGNNFKIVKMLDNELLITGKIKEILFNE